jgi:predicted adenylyl cyclase CyaB
MPLNVEIKARCKDLEHLHGILMKSGADFKGTDRQEDRYYRAAEGRLKLRQGPIENTLIHYHRPENTGTKTSDVALFHPSEPRALQAVLDRALELRVVVAKERRIYFHGNIKFHLDRVEGLGDFVEIEAIDRDGARTREDLEVQCQAWMTRLGIKPEDGIAQSYSDMLLSKAAAS